MKYNDQTELLKEYLGDAAESVDEFEGLLLQLEQMTGGDPDPVLINNILGLLHTFKGNSGMMGFSSLQSYIHKLEGIFKSLQGGSVKLNNLLAEFFMQSASVLRRAVSEISLQNPSDPSINNDIKILEEFICEQGKGISPAAGEPLATAGSLAEAGLSGAATQKTNVLKVEFERLDHLLNLMGEMVIYRTRLGRIEAQLRESFGEKGVALDLSSTSEQIGKVSTELHEAIMKVRMLPIKQVFMRFPRMVRDLARSRGKEISLQFEGEETELDKTIIDEIGEPLLHLIRNAVDHGIESPETRLKLGKPRQGTILIRVYQESSHIIIIVEDDGRGIDKERLRQKAEQAGVFRNNTADGQNLLDLIYVPGISTAKEITEVSGRGVGMDVVKKSLAKINGSIEVETEINVGTRFTIKLPLTLAIVSALMVGASGQQYAIPLASVVESVKVRQADIHLINQREVTNVRGRILPLARLSELFGLARSANAEINHVVIVQSATGKIGVVVDSLLGQQEIVIKALDDYIGDSEGIAGATILGDGKVVLIVDVLELTEKFRHHYE